MAIRPPSIRAISWPICLMRTLDGKKWKLGKQALNRIMFRNRLHVEGVYYKKNTKDLLAKVPGLSGTIPGIGIWDR